MSTQQVSVIIPCHNSAAYIEETLQSVYNQSHTAIQIIAVDDASTDKTLQILESHSAQISIISLTRNHGVSQARTLGAQKASGTYLLFLDSDDTLHPQYLQKAVNILQHQPEVSVVHSRAQYFGAKNREWKLPDFHMQDFLLSNSVFMPAVIRKSAYDQTTGFDPQLTMFEDWELFIQIARNGGQFHKIDEILFNYRKREDQSSITDHAARHPQEISDNYLHIYLKHYPFYLQHGIYMQDLMSYRQYRTKYYNTWYRKLFYTLNPKKQQT
ncbi:MAG: glycosyltransferase [Weeksellaceae bacterium]|nr:glycosyltransferase [Weeksellaceae bacterium]